MLVLVQMEAFRGMLTGGEVLVVGGGCGLGLLAVAVGGLGWLGGLRAAGIAALLVIWVGDAELRKLLAM